MMDRIGPPQSTQGATYTRKPGHFVKFYNDASESSNGVMGAFADIVQAVQAAHHFIFICDWSFHPGLRMIRTGQNDPIIGDLLLQRAASGVLVAIHTWGHNPAAPDDVNDNALKQLTAMAKALPQGDDVIGRRLLWRASRRTGVGYSHHQKFVVLDAPVNPEEPHGPRAIKVFFGGLDLTAGRFDWPDHILPAPNDHRGLFRPDDWYNGEFGNDPQQTREPWHDIHAQMIGPAAWDFIYEFVGRWSRNPAGAAFTAGHYDAKAVSLVWDKFVALREAGQKGPKIYQDYEKLPEIFTLELKMKPSPTNTNDPPPLIDLNFDTPQASNSSATPVSSPEMVMAKTKLPVLWSAQILRSIEKEHWGVPPGYEHAPHAAHFQWKLKQGYEASIEQAYVDLISHAEDYIYIESQYFIGSGHQWGRKSVTNRVPEAIVNRIVEKHSRQQPFHVYILLPMFPEGVPTSEAIIGVRTLQWNTINWMLKALNENMVTDWDRYLSFYFLGQWSHNPALYGTAKTRAERLAASRRYMVYVHSKMMIVDDKHLIIGSANLNERSLAGNRDTEICVLLTPDPGKEDEVVGCVREFRGNLWIEHLGEGWHKTVGKDRLYLQPNTPECIKLVHATTLRNYRRFLSGDRDGSEGHMMMWPLLWSNGKLDFSNLGFNDGRVTLIPDYTVGKERSFAWIPEAISFVNNPGSGYIIE